MHVGGTGLDAAGVPPNGVQYFLARYHPSGAPQEKHQKVVFHRCEGDFLPMTLHHPPFQIGFGVAEADDLGGNRRRAAQDGPHPREEFAETEGLHRRARPEPPVYQPTRIPRRNVRSSMPSRPVFAIPSACMKLPLLTLAVGLE